MQIALAVALNVLADLCAQAIRLRQGGKSVRFRDFEWLTCVRALVWALLCTPLVGRWLSFLESFFGEGVDWESVLQKMAADQLVFSPFLLLTFLLYVGMCPTKFESHMHSCTRVRRHIPTPSMRVCKPTHRFF